MFDEKLSILVPFKPDGGPREKNWAWIKRRYELLLPNAELCIGLHSGSPFSKSTAVNRAARMATRDLYLIADADITFDVKQMETAVEMLTDHIWVIPFRDRKELNEEQTEDLIAKDPCLTLSRMDFSNHQGYLNNVGSVNLVPRKYFEQVGGFDERFRGWGGEDEAFQMSMDTLCGPHARPRENSIWHLYHPQSISTTYHAPAYQHNYDVFWRYKTANGNREAMEAVLKERASESEA